MPQALRIKLDVTTFYSTLGLTSNATDAEIQKSYRKLARELHPDKSKSESAAELFKVICNAYSNLMDKEEKSRYDIMLRSKGLAEYFPKDNCHRFSGLTTSSSENVPGTAFDQAKTPQKSRPSQKPNYRPYEQQPYGFGTGNDINTNFSSHSKVPIFQSFNLKNYQRSQRSAQKDRNKVAGTESRTGGSEIRTPPPKNSYDEPNDKRGDLKDERDEKLSDDEKGEGVRPKLHKANISDPFEHLSGSPFVNNRHRHYARTKHEARTQERRSVSPVKTTPNNENSHMSESWDTLKNILKDIKEQEKKTSARRDEIEIIQKGEPIKSTKVRKAESQSIKLDDLSNSLPIDDDSFDMRKVSDTLDSVPVVKKAKIGGRKDSPDAQSEERQNNPETPNQRNGNARANRIPSNIAESLFMPVNHPLPKIYKPEVIALDQYRINSKVINLELPKMPNFQCNILDKSDVETCKEYVKQFNAEANFLKLQLLTTLSERLEADRQLNDKLVKVENTANWVSCKDFDFEIISRLNELNNRQRIVAQSFSNLLKTMYAVEHHQ